MKKEELSQMRSAVIDKFIYLESKMSLIISQHYFGTVYLPFLLEVLYDEYFTFSLRRRILWKILKQAKFNEKDISKQIENLNRLNTIRNYFAHVGLELLVRTRSDGKEIRMVSDPRKPLHPVDFKSLYQEFLQKEPGISMYLLRIHEHLVQTRRRQMKKNS